MPLAPTSIYTIRHPDDLEHLAARKAPVKLHDKKRWVVGEKNFRAARARGLDFPLLFADAAFDCSKLIYWGKITRLKVTSSGTDYTVGDFTPLRDRRTQELVLTSTGKCIAEGYIWPYALVHTPDFIGERAESETGHVDATLFTFGYWGCGSATVPLVKAIDAAEARRGFGPPLWVDIRISRSVQAAGFRGDAFHSLLGSRYVWMSDLGNLSIIQGGDDIRIKNPAATTGLLEKALEDPSRRVIFFCACDTPSECHRARVAELVIRAAKKLKRRVRVVEWPGGVPGFFEFNVPPGVLKNLTRGSLLRIPVTGAEVARATSIPCGSTVLLRAGGESWTAFVGPIRFDSFGAFLPILDAEQATPRSLKAAGFTPRSSMGS